MTSDEPRAPGTGTPAPEYTHFAEPRADRSNPDSDWSQPTLIRHAEPATDVPATDVPATDLPASEASPVEAPAAEPAATEPAATEAPANEAPANEAPGAEPSQSEAPAPGGPRTDPVYATEAPPPVEADPVDEPRSAGPPWTAWSEPTSVVPPVEPVREAPPAAEAAPVEAPEPDTRPTTGRPSNGRPTNGPPANYYVPPAAARRAQVTYERGSAPNAPQPIVEQAADVAMSAMVSPLRILDVGCGEGALLAELILRVPYAEVYVGLDPVPGLVPDELRESDPRLGIVRGAAESLPFGADSFDLVVAMLSFPYWKDQRAGLAELARVVAANGKVVLVEPAGGDDGRVHSPKKVGELLAAAGLTVERTETVGRSRLGRAIARAFVAAP